MEMQSRTHLPEYTSEQMEGRAARLSAMEDEAAMYRSAAEAEAVTAEWASGLSNDALEAAWVVARSEPLASVTQALTVVGLFVERAKRGLAS